jgi:PleD family two-component response regulator
MSCPQRAWTNHAIGAERPPRAEHLAPGAERLRVLIADHDGFARGMMSTALREAAGVAIVGTARDSREAFELVRHYRPTMLIVDTALPPTGSLELVGEVLLASPDEKYPHSELVRTPSVVPSCPPHSPLERRGRGAGGSGRDATPPARI